MKLASGTDLLHYSLIEKIGEGGMGIVWKAVDTTLDREVAVKVLPETFVDDTERLQRFEREAKLLASINHPNIASVFGVHQFEGTRFLAMELAPGEDLAQLLTRGRLPVDQAMDIARQIAEGLEAAHRCEVIHRDLKPANIKVCPGGSVKILDFGLAKSLPANPASGTHQSSSPTMTSAGTVAGVILGTAAYMSPEQARGQAVDQRSDIWSFGCVLWECLTGEVLFGGDTASDSIGAVLNTDPDMSRLSTETPAAVRRLIRRCLAKKVRDRFHSIADVRIELEDPDPPSLDVTISRPANRAAALVLAAILVAGSTAGLLYITRPWAGQSDSPGENPIAGARFTKITDFEGSEFEAAISPDGRFVAFVADRDGPFEIFVGQIGVGGFRKLVSGTDEFAMEDARAPVRSVGFSGDGSEIWLGGGPRRRMRSVPLLGGSMRNFLGEQAVNVAWSPDGKSIVYHERLAGDPLYVADSNGTNRRKILGSPAGTHQHYPTWSADGHWIYLVRGRPATLEMDLWRVRVDGEGLQQMTWGKLDVRNPTPIDDDTLLYVARDADGAGPWLWSLDANTKVSRRAGVGLEQYSSVEASADGRRLVATVQNSQAGLWTVPILDHTSTESDAKPFIDLQATRALAPRFAGSSLFFLSSRGSGDGLWRFKGGVVSEVWRGSETALLEPAGVSHDGDSVVLLLRKDGALRLHTLRSDGTQLRILTEKVDARGEASWSPDGRWIVSGGYQDGVEGLFKIPVDGGALQRIVDGQALDPVWSPDGNLIVYTGAQVNVVSPLLAVRPNGDPVNLPEIEVFRFGQRARFLPDGSGLVFMQGLGPSQNFWLLDLESMKKRRLTQLDTKATMRTFDVTPDGKQIVFDRLSENSDIVLIEIGGSEQK